MATAKTASASPPKLSESWVALQSAFCKCVEEAVAKAAHGGSHAGGSHAARAPEGQAEIKKVVTETVSSVLLETNLVERVVERHLKSKSGAAAHAGAPGGKDVEEAVRDYLEQNLAKLFQSEIPGAIQRELKPFINSDEIKELIDEKFRTITNYLKSEVIPK